MAISKTSASFRKCGLTLDYTPSADVAAGTVVLACGIPCLALWDVPKGTASTLKVLHRGEVVDVTTDEAVGETAAGTAIYVTSSGLVTKTASGATLLGYAAKAVGATDTAFSVVCA